MEWGVPEVMEQAIPRDPWTSELEEHRDAHGGDRRGGGLRLTGLTSTSCRPPPVQDADEKTGSTERDSVHARRQPAM